MKFALLPFMVFAILVSGCAEKHYSRLTDNKITFYYKDPEAQEIFFASSRDNYKLLAAQKSKDHLWEVSIPAEKGFAYFYVVDGVITLPPCPLTENDDYGSKNCLYVADM